VSLVGDGLSDPAEATVTATLDKDAMELVIGNGPGMEIVAPKSLFHAHVCLLEFVGHLAPCVIGQGR
jgi:hypothetical protein